MSVLEDLKWVKFPVLDQGFVCLVDAMGDDSSVVQAARVSYGTGTKKPSSDRDLIRYLMRNRHDTPFEMATIKILVRLPMDVSRQWWRHRAASINEYSTRYSEAIDAMQATPPDGWRLQAKDNKQGSGELIPARGTGLDWSGDDLSDLEANFHESARNIYRLRIERGIAREQARKDLPLSTYTEAYWSANLRNTLHFLALRMDGHAQAEIRSYANVIGREIVAKLFPATWQAFEDYRLGAVTLSRVDAELIRHVVAGCDPGKALAGLFANARERAEARDKLVGLGLLSEGGIS